MGEIKKKESNLKHGDKLDKSIYSQLVSMFGKPDIDIYICLSVNLRILSHLFCK